jgi:hypothetical protein
MVSVNVGNGSLRGRSTEHQNVFLTGSPSEGPASFETRLVRRMAPSGTLRRVILVRTDVSEELSASFNMVTRIGELGTTLAVTNNLATSVGRFLQEPHGVTSQKTPCFIVTAVKASSLTQH